MRSSIFFAAPLVAFAAAQSPANETVPTTTTASYDNPFTSFLTQTNSLGVVTGQPKPATDVGVAATNAAVSSAVVQLVPAGLSAGTLTTLVYGNSTSGNATSIVVSIGSSTTAVVSTAVISTTGSAVQTLSSEASGSASRSSTRGSSGTSAGSASSASSTGSAAHVKVASGALIGAGAFFAAFM